MTIFSDAEYLYNKSIAKSIDANDLDIIINWPLD